MCAVKQFPARMRQRPALLIGAQDDQRAEHWQSAWQQVHPHWQRLRLDASTESGWQQGMQAIDARLRQQGPGAMLVASGAACMAVVHWTARSALTERVHGALLVDVPGPLSAQFPDALALTPQLSFPFPCMVVHRSGSRIEDANYSRRWAHEHEARWVHELTAAGDTDGWPGGYRLLQKLAAFS